MNLHGRAVPQKKHFRPWFLKQVLIWVLFCELLAEIDLIRVFFCELLTEIILVMFFLYTGLVNTEKEVHNGKYGTQSYYYYVVLYPTSITTLWAMIILSHIKHICKVIYCCPTYNGFFLFSNKRAGNGKKLSLPKVTIMKVLQFHIPKHYLLKDK
jgi:hypothetical protein